MDSVLENMVRELHDRDQIKSVMLRYTRGVDRMDRDLFLSAYHNDAVDDHGFFVGGPVELWDWVSNYHSKAQATHQHIITNHTCDLDGDVAHCETYWMLAGMDAADDSLSIGGGRYIDRVERRQGEWRIAARKCVSEWGGTPVESKVPPHFLAMLRESGVVARDSSDSSYERPLEVNPQRVGISFDILS